MLIRDTKLFDAAFWGGIVRIISVGGFSVLTAYTAVSFYPLDASDRGIVTLGSKLLFIVTVTFVVHIGVSRLFSLQEVGPVFTWLKRLLKPIRIQY
jgi:hypothetical protein